MLSALSAVVGDNTPAAPPLPRIAMLSKLRFLPDNVALPPPPLPTLTIGDMDPTVGVGVALDPYPAAAAVA